MNNIKLLSIFILTLFFSSCFKKENALKLPEGNTTIKTLFLGNDYQNEVYFDLGSNSFQQRPRSNWDMRFESGPNSWGVFINTGNDIRVRKLDLHSLFEPLTWDTMNIISKDTLLDDPNGRAESSAFKDWNTTYRTKKDTNWLAGIYIVELNYIQGHRRFKRVQIESVDNEKYVCTFTDLYNDNGSPITNNPVKTVIMKNSAQNFTYISFDGGFHVIENQEPDRSTWDFVFTRYTHFFYDILPNGQPFPYILTGVLSSKNNVVVAKDSTSDFNDINYAAISRYTFSDNANAIGYDWKNHAFGAAGTYTVNSKVTYIIKDTEGQYFKLRFLDFYNAKGDKGYPKFEFIQIL